MKKFDLFGRLVEICYDSDAIANPAVMRAELELCRALIGENAKPRVVRLPSIDHSRKTGLDDFLIARGVKSFDKLQRTKSRILEDLAEFCENWAVVREPFGFLEIKTERLYSKDHFVDLNRPKKVRLEVKKGKGEKVEIKEVTMPLSDVFCDSIFKN